MESLKDPERLRDREDVRFREETRVLDREAFETVRDTVDSHVAVGITNDRGEVLLTNDGSHGWTLPAFTVESGADWAVTARRGFERQFGVALALERPELVRRIEFRLEDGEADRRTEMYNVVFGATVTERPETGRTVESVDVDWFDDVPPEQEGGLADDIRLFLN